MNKRILELICKIVAVYIDFPLNYNDRFKIVPSFFSERKERCVEQTHSSIRAKSCPLLIKARTRGTVRIWSSAEVRWITILRARFFFIHNSGMRMDRM